MKYIGKSHIIKVLLPNMTFYALRKKKLRHGNEFIYVQNSAEMRETEGKSCTFLFMLLYCYMKKMAANKNSCNLRNIWGA